MRRADRPAIGRGLRHRASIVSQREADTRASQSRLASERRAAEWSRPAVVSGRHCAKVGRPLPPSARPAASTPDAVEVRWSPRARRWRLEVPWGRRRGLTVPWGRIWPTCSSCSSREKRPWILEQRVRQVPRLCLDPSAVSESEARTGARELVSALADEEAERIGVEYRRIRIGGQRTLWGSCSPGGTLSFNWRLVLALLEVLDYVVVHELYHLRPEPLATILGTRRATPPALAPAARLAARSRSELLAFQAAR